MVTAFLDLGSVDFILSGVHFQLLYSPDGAKASLNYYYVLLSISMASTFETFLEFPHRKNNTQYTNTVSRLDTTKAFLKNNSDGFYILFNSSKQSGPSTRSEETYDSYTTSDHNIASSVDGSILTTRNLSNWFVFNATGEFTNKKTTTPDDATTTPDDAITAPDESTTKLDGAKTTPDDATTTPDDVTTALDNATFVPGNATFASGNATTAPDIATTAPKLNVTTYGRTSDMNSQLIAAFSATERRLTERMNTSDASVKIEKDSTRTTLSINTDNITTLAFTENYPETDTPLLKIMDRSFNIFSSKVTSVSTASKLFDSNLSNNSMATIFSRNSMANQTSIDNPLSDLVEVTSTNYIDRSTDDNSISVTNRTVNTNSFDTSQFGVNISNSISFTLNNSFFTTSQISYVNSSSSLPLLGKNFSTIRQISVNDINLAPLNNLSSTMNQASISNSLALLDNSFPVTIGKRFIQQKQFCNQSNNGRQYID